MTVGAILLLGGRSEIGLAIVEELLRARPGEVVLAERPGQGPDAERERTLRRAGATAVEVVDFDAERLDTHEGVVDDVFARHRVDVAVVAFGILGDQEKAWQDVAAAQRLLTVDATAPAGIGVVLAKAFDRQADGSPSAQADEGERGTIIALSSMAGTRVRRSNFVYGSAKAAMDAFYLNLAVAVGPRGPRILVVRPGAVSTRMIAGRRPVALTTSTGRVARAVVARLDGSWGPGSAQVLHVPGLFAAVSLLAPLVPRRLWQRLNG